MAGTKSSGGRNAKSKTALLLTGTFRKDRHGQSNTTDPPKGRPPTPKKLKGDALAEWNRMADRLGTSQTLSIVDDAVLYRYCQLHARAERLERQIARLKSAFYLDHMGNPKVHPAFAQLRAYDQALRVYLVEFGMTPAARSRVTPASDGKAPANPLDRFLKTRA